MFAQISGELPIFKVMPDSVEEVLVHLHKRLGELHFPLLKKYIKKGANLFEMATAEIGGIDSGRNKTQKNSRMIWEKKQSGNIWEMERNLNIEQARSDTFLEKVGWKTVALA